MTGFVTWVTPSVTWNRDCAVRTLKVLGVLLSPAPRRRSGCPASTTSTFRLPSQAVGVCSSRVAPRVARETHACWYVTCGPDSRGREVASPSLIANRSVGRSVYTQTRQHPHISHLWTSREDTPAHRVGGLPLSLASRTINRYVLPVLPHSILLTVMSRRATGSPQAMIVVLNELQLDDAL